MNPRACPGVAVGAPVDLSPLSPRSGLPPRARLPPSFHSRRGLESLVDLPSSSSVSRNDAAESSRWVSPPPLLAGGPLPSGLPPSPVGVISPACSRVFRTPLTGGVGVFPAFPRRCASLPCAGVARCGPRPPVSSRRIPCRCVCVPRPGGPLACVASGACLSRGGRARGVLGFRRVGLPGSAPPAVPCPPARPAPSPVWRGEPPFPWVAVAGRFSFCHYSAPIDFSRSVPGVGRRSGSPDAKGWGGKRMRCCGGQRERGERVCPGRRVLPLVRSFVVCAVLVRARTGAWTPSLVGSLAARTPVPPARLCPHLE